MVAKNVIDAEQPRIGYLFDGDPNTPLLTAQLRRSEEGITVEVPWMDREPTHQHQRWFGDISYGDDPKREKYRYEPPEGIDFHDQLGHVVLIGCRDLRSSRTFPVGVGTGTLSVDFAILDATGGRRYSRINGLRSEIEGLGAWIGLRSLDARQEYSNENRLISATLHLKSPDPIKISRQLNLKIRPAYRYGPGEHPDETTITERMLVETRVSKPRSWDDHLSPHEAIRDLVRIAAWQDFTFQAHEATRDDDPIRTLDGKGHGSRWYRVETSLTGIAPPTVTRGGPSFLFTFNDIGREGVNRWLRLSEQMSRGISQIVRLLELREATAVTHVAQLGIGLEAIGFALAREAGLNRKKAGDERFDERIERLANDCPSPFPIDREAWLKSMPRIYNGVKHANRTMPGQAELANGYWQSLLIFRWWLAGRLGARRKALRERVKEDRMAIRARAADDRRQQSGDR